jgi:hypothetical protein
MAQFGQLQTLSLSSQFPRNRPFNGANDRQEIPIWAPRRGSLNILVHCTPPRKVRKIPHVDACERSVRPGIGRQTGEDCSFDDAVGLKNKCLWEGDAKRFGRT